MPGSGTPGAPYQHFIMAAFRAIETRRSLVRAANTGISGFIDPVGRVLAKTGLFEETALTHKIPVIRDYQTFYTRHGDLLIWVCFIASVLCIMITLYYTGKSKKLNYISPSPLTGEG